MQAHPREQKAVGSSSCVLTTNRQRIVAPGSACAPVVTLVIHQSASDALSVGHCFVNGIYQKGCQGHANDIYG